jgi:hypothetical protein
MRVAWRWEILAVLPLAALAWTALRIFGRTPRIERPSTGGHRLATLLAAAALLLLAGATITARATSPDLLYFWGAKAERFATARTVDVAYLADPDHILMHPDYPPLLPLVFVAGVLLGGRMSWLAALTWTPLFVAAGVVFFGFRARATAAAMLAAVSAYVVIATLSAGNAEAPLFCFVVLALSILRFGSGCRREMWLASLVLCGAAMTKIEGIAFAAATVGAWLMFHARERDAVPMAARLASLPALWTAVWFGFCRLHGLAGTMVGGMGATGIHFEHLPAVLAGLAREASWHCGWAPWIVVAMLAIVRPPGRRALFPAAVGVAQVAALIVFYLHSVGDPSLWISWSAGRVLLVPWVAFFIAAVSGERNLVTSAKAA